MYFKERKMEQENQYFIYRVGQLPLVKAAYDSATNVYTATKNYNSLLNATLQMAENSVKYASEVEGVKKVLHNPLVSIANNIAVSQLDKLEQKYPSIKKTPDQRLMDSASASPSDVADLRNDLNQLRHEHEELKSWGMSMMKDISELKDRQERLECNQERLECNQKRNTSIILSWPLDLYNFENVVPL